MCVCVCEIIKATLYYFVFVDQMNSQNISLARTDKDMFKPVAFTATKCIWAQNNQLPLPLLPGFKSRTVKLSIGTEL